MGVHLRVLLEPQMIDPKSVSKGTARVIPVLIVGIIAYASYVVVGPLCVTYLLRGSLTQLRFPRRRQAIAILVIFSILLFFVAATYLRILQTLATDPGYVERSALYKDSQKRKAHGHKSKSDKNRKSRDNSAPKTEKVIGGDPIAGQPYSETIESHRPVIDSEQPGLAAFYSRDVFVCEGDGRPPWCTVCMSWKPDRAHHCREVARCVRKMDHFCPWVGGIVSETNFKFFMQFVAWTSAFCLFVLIVLAIYLREKGADAHFIATIALAGFFFFFTAGMTLTTFRSILINSTSVENLSLKVKVWSLAVYLPHPPERGSNNFQTITFPLSPPKPGTTPPAPRTFAILHSKPGDNPFDLGPFDNFRSVMGNTIWDWIFPLRRSPKHRSGESEWPLGPAFQRMKEDAGLGKRKRSQSQSR